jgi:hypothetical protein
MDAARFSPTWQQALARGVYLGVLVSVVTVSAGLLAAMVARSSTAAVAPSAWLWVVLVFGPPLTGALLGVLLRPRVSTEISAGGIRTVTPFGAGVQPWSRVVDLRAERRGARTVVSVYLESGASVQLQAPYSGELFAADPQFELKVFALSHLWRSHRFGGVPS